MRLSGENRVASKHFQKWFERAETGDLAGVFVVVGVRVFMHGTSHWYPRRSTGLSYLLAQM